MTLKSTLWYIGIGIFIICLIVFSVLNPLFSIFQAHRIEQNSSDVVVRVFGTHPSPVSKISSRASLAQAAIIDNNTENGLSIASDTINDQNPFHVSSACTKTYGSSHLGEDILKVGINSTVTNQLDILVILNGSGRIDPSLPYTVYVSVDITGSNMSLFGEEFLVAGGGYKDPGVTATWKNNTAVYFNISSSMVAGSDANVDVSINDIRVGYSSATFSNALDVQTYDDFNFKTVNGTNIHFGFGYQLWSDTSGFFEPMDPGTAWSGLDVNALIVSNNNTYIMVRLRLSGAGTADPTLPACLGSHAFVQLNVQNPQNYNLANRRLYLNGTVNRGYGVVKWINSTYAIWAVPLNTFGATMNMDVDVFVTTFVDIPTSQGDILNPIDIFYLSGTHNGYHYLTSNLPSPSIVITNPSNNSYIGTSALTMHWSASTARVETYQLYVNSNLQATLYGSTTTYQLTLSAGSYNITLQAESYTTQITVESIYIGVDLVPPTISIVNPAIENLTVSSFSYMFNLSWKASDNIALAKFTVLANTSVIATNLAGIVRSYLVTITHEGTYNLSVLAYDSAGNTQRASMLLHITQSQQSSQPVSSSPATNNSTNTPQSSLFDPVTVVLIFLISVGVISGAGLAVAYRRGYLTKYIEQYREKYGKKEND